MNPQNEKPDAVATASGLHEGDRLDSEVTSTNNATDRAEQESYRRYVLAEIRCAVARRQLEVNDLTVVGIACKQKWITPDEALAHLHARDVLQYLGAST